MNTKNKYKEDDIVGSSPNSSDITHMKAIWVAVILEYKGQTSEGHHAYETLGHWEPIKDSNGEVSDFWKNNPWETEPTLRTLWETHLKKIEGFVFVEFESRFYHMDDAVTYGIDQFKAKPNATPASLISMIEA
tara:strand:+ start:2802 stop:3200 length:399 start_codon:yes stop_codon:yes gene_type:complete